MGGDFTPTREIGEKDISSGKLRFKSANTRGRRLLLQANGPGAFFDQAQCRVYIRWRAHPEADPGGRAEDVMWFRAPRCDEGVRTLPGEMDVEETVAVQVCELHASMGKSDSAEPVQAGSHARQLECGRLQRLDRTKPRPVHQSRPRQEQRVEKLGRERTWASQRRRWTTKRNML